jgi:DNA modification methylase
LRVAGNAHYLVAWVPFSSPARPGQVSEPVPTTRFRLHVLVKAVETSSNPGDLVLDPFCGCGTTIAAAQKLGRKWVGIDITHLSIALMRYRLEAMFPGI